MARPVVELNEGVRAIGRGELETRMAITGSDEISALAASFNDMSKNLDSSRNALTEKTVGFSRGDIFLFHTDGIAETLDGRQDLYGNERLAHRLRATAHDRSAREIRDTLLGDVWNFKGDGEQTDDITMVVVKVR